MAIHWSTPSSMRKSFGILLGTLGDLNTHCLDVQFVDLTIALHTKCHAIPSRPILGGDGLGALATEATSLKATQDMNTLKTAQDSSKAVQPMQPSNSRSVISGDSFCAFAMEATLLKTVQGKAS